MKNFNYRLEKEIEDVDAVKKRLDIWFDCPLEKVKHTTIYSINNE